MDKHKNITNPPEETTSYPPYASLIVQGKDLNPQKITEILGIPATTSFQRGDKRKTGKPWPHGSWWLDSQGQIQSPNLTFHIEWILEKVEPVQEKLLEHIQEQSLNACISCFWIMPTSNQQLIFEPDLINRLARCKLALDIDIFSPD